MSISPSNFNQSNPVYQPVKENSEEQILTNSTTNSTTTSQLNFSNQVATQEEKQEVKPEEKIINPLKRKTLDSEIEEVEEKWGCQEIPNEPKKPEEKIINPLKRDLPDSDTFEPELKLQRLDELVEQFEKLDLKRKDAFLREGPSMKRHANFLGMQACKIKNLNFYNSIYSKDQWEVLGEIQDELKVPEYIISSLDQDCMLSPGKKVHETHILFQFTSHLNEKKLTLFDFANNIAFKKRSLEGEIRLFHGKDQAEFFKKQSVSTSYYLLIYKEMVPVSVYKKSQVQEYYQIPTVTEGIQALYITHLNQKGDLLTKDKGLQKTLFYTFNFKKSKAQLKPYEFSLQSRYFSKYHGNKKDFYKVQPNVLLVRKMLADEPKTNLLKDMR